MDIVLWRVSRDGLFWWNRSPANKTMSHCKDIGDSRFLVLDL